MLTLGEVEESNELKATLCSNMAACQLQKSNFAHARDLCQMALELKPDQPKALYRLADASINLKVCALIDFVICGFQSFADFG
jgi:Tfp pilus assembly protein PilF